MAEEENDKQTEQEATPAEEAPAAEEKAEQPEAEEKAEEAPEAEQAPEAEAEEKPEDAQADEAPPDEAPAGEKAPAEDEGLDWKARRRLERSRRSGAPGPQRSPADRAEERAERRRAAARERSSYRRNRRKKSEAGIGTPAAERRSVGRKERRGRVVSSKPDKTITVRIDIARRHPTYEKIVRQTGTLHAHDAGNEANEGDLVRVVETRPISRTKRWRLVEILEKAK
jgi:small subunit ribosomal protein S17